MERAEIITLLQSCNFRCTNARIDVLLFFRKQQRPIGIDAVARAFPSVNLATLYRMMEAFESAGVVSTHDLGHGHKDYELANRPHHHHAICERCGKVEDVFSCTTICRFEQAIAQAAREIETITRHSATFYGTCHTCK